MIRYLLLLFCVLTAGYIVSGCADATGPNTNSPFFAVSLQDSVMHRCDSSILVNEGGCLVVLGQIDSAVYFLSMPFPAITGTSLVTLQIRKNADREYDYRTTACSLTLTQADSIHVKGDFSANFPGTIGHVAGSFYAKR
jgi:hypothetical protein